MKKMMKLAVILMCAGMLLTSVTALADTGKIKGHMVFGDDLSKAQRAELKDKMSDMLDGNVDNYDFEVTYCTNAEEHKAFDSYLDKKVIGSRAISSIMLVPRKEGEGISVKLYNINYCTKEMYQNALISAGVQDVEVIVGAPFEVSGTCALVSALNAYELLTGEDLDADAEDTAIDELVATGEIGDAIGDKEDAAQLIATLKQELAEHKDDLDDNQLEQLIDRTADEMDIDLDRELKMRLLELLKKLQNIDLDVDSLKQQAGALYEKVSGLLSKLDVNLPEKVTLPDKVELPEIDKEQTLSFLQRLIQMIKDLFGWK